MRKCTVKNRVESIALDNTETELKFRKYIPDYLLLFFIAGIVILVDQVTKHLVRTNLMPGEIVSLSSYIEVVHWSNAGAALGILENMNLLFIGLGILICIFIVYYNHQPARHEWLLRLSLALILGGTIGNIIDRLARGYVTDFLILGRFAIVNVADISIYTGVAILFYSLWARNRRSKTDEAALSESSVMEREMATSSADLEQGGALNGIEDPPAEEAKNIIVENNLEA